MLRRLGVWWVGAAACSLPIHEVSTGASGSSGGTRGSSGGATSEASGSSAGAPTTGGGPDLGAPACVADSPEARMGCVDVGRYVADLEFIAAARPPGSPHWLAVQERCAEALEEAGLEVTLQAYETGVNVVGTRAGEGPASEEVVLLSAHYDHVPGCPGADDNASGVAGALEIARALAGARLQRTLVVACWDEEEVGLFGSKAYVASIDPASIALAVNFDMIGYASDAPGSQFFPGPLADRFPALAAELEVHEHRGDFLAVVSDDRAEPFALELEARAESIGRLTGVLALGAAEKLDPAYELLALSDHRSFWERDVPALLVFDTGVFRNRAYHCEAGLDTVDRLDPKFAGDVLAATTALLAAAAGWIE